MASITATTASDPYPHVTPSQILKFHTASGANENGVVHDVGGFGEVGVQVKGTTWTGTINFEVSIDGVNFVAAQAVNQATGAVVTTTAADGIFVVTLGAATVIRCRQSGFAAGTVAVTGRSRVWPSRMLSTTAATAVVDTELPAAALMTDNTVTPTAPAVAAFGMQYDGATWDFMRGDATNGTKVQPAVGGAGAVTAATPRTTLASDDPAVVALQIIDDWDETNRAAVNLIAGQVGVQAGAGAVDALTQRVAIATDANDVDVLSLPELPLNESSATYAPTLFSNLGADATLNVKATAGNVFSVYCNNENASDRFLQLHNTATVPAGAAVPLYTFRVPATGDVLIGTDFFTAKGGRFTTGIAFAFSTTKDTYTAGTNTDQTTLIHFK